MSLTSVELFETTMGVSVCRSCWLSGVVMTVERESVFFVRCSSCEGRGVDFSKPALRLSERVFQLVEKGVAIDERLFVMARALVHATPHVPASRALLMSLTGAAERDVKDFARTLRREWLLPVGSSRQKPYGYYWISAAADYLTWSRPFRAQALDELVTEYRLRRANFPELGGQSSFEFVHDLQHQIEEALI